ncbi:MAG: FAD-binding oxidoreductase [Hyphomicrobium sp.]|nr:FAD-binding oxidoreductase [Hyphomicrobium sp.]
MAEDHVGSYYAATLNDKTRYPALDGDTRVDVAIVGGGFSGIATALTFAERGRSVALVEMNRIGWGASGRNGGQLIAGISGEGEFARQAGVIGRHVLDQIRYLGHDIIEGRIARYGIDCDLKHGWMEVAARPSHMKGIRAHVAEMQEKGYGSHHQIVEPDDLPAIIGTEKYYGGFIDRRSGHLHPLNLCLGEARAAASLGARIFEETKAIEITGGKEPLIRTDRGTIRADAVVLAGDTAHQFDRGRLNGLHFPTGTYIIATEPLSETEVAAINPQDLAICDTNTVLDYYRLSADRRMLFGGRCNYTNRDPADIAGTMKARLTEIFPQLSEKRVDYVWSGRIGIVLTRVPAIGRLEPNLYYMQGYCGHGVNATHIAAEIVADAIQGTTDRFDVFDKIRQVRLPIGQWAGNQLLALGMTYYRLRDML